MPVDTTLSEPSRVRNLRQSVTVQRVRKRAKHRYSVDLSSWRGHVHRRARTSGGHPTPIAASFHQCGHASGGMTTFASMVHIVLPPGRRTSGACISIQCRVNCSCIGQAAGQATSCSLSLDISKGDETSINTALFCKIPLSGASNTSRKAGPAVLTIHNDVLIVHAVQPIE